jgi:hypothetical protein
MACAAAWYQHEGLVELLRALRRWHVALTTELIWGSSGSCRVGTTYLANLVHSLDNP